MSSRLLITGCAGFIGFHLADHLLGTGARVVGIDDLNAYYDPALKSSRLGLLERHSAFRFERIDIADRAAVRALFREDFDAVLHLAAQAGVRYSVTCPAAYVDSNLVGFANVLEGCRAIACPHLVYASSSAVYGANTRLPFSTDDPSDHPVSFYAATKQANEGMAHSYAHLFALPSTGLRFFTVYGPWGRPDMAVSLFAEALMAAKPIRLFNAGHMWRDHTYVGDVVEAVSRLIDQPPAPDPTWSGDAPNPATSAAPWRILNIGSGRSTEMLEILRLLEHALDRRAIIVTEPMQAGEVPVTFADTGALERLTGYKPATSIEVGIERFASWYTAYRVASDAA